MTFAARNLTICDRLDDVTTELEPGAITAICGPNGAGKSTLLSALAGLVAPDSGTVSIDGEALASLHPRKRAQCVGYLPQDPDIAWDVSVRNLVALGRMPHRDRGGQAVEAAIGALDLVALADRPASRLSGGEKARTLLARVLAGEPDWILADEPLAALDLAHQLALLGHLRAAADREVGIVLVVHDLALAMNYADRVLVLDRGRLAAAGPAAEAIDVPVIERVWGVSGRWIGDPGAQAFVIAEEPTTTVS